MGILRLLNMSFYGYHGVSDAEKLLGTRFEVDVEVCYDTSKPAKSEKLSDAVNYEKIYALVKDFITTHKFHLMEGLTEGLAEHLWDSFTFDGLRVRIRKVSPPFPGHLDAVELETTRGKFNAK